MTRSDVLLHASLLAVLLAMCPWGRAADASLGEPSAQQVDEIVLDELRRTGVAGVSIALVQSRRVSFVRAYGRAELNPVRAATPAQRYRIGSVSKQFVAAALLAFSRRAGCV